MATGCSLVSAGTERAVRKLASANLVEKARARPDLVRQVLRKVRVDGVLPTVRAVRTRLDDEMPLGYSAAGTVLEVGEAVVGIRPGDRVATGGAGHASVQAVAGLLATRLPEGVSDADAAFATLGAIALHGFRLAEAGPGSRIAVIGLGLVGQLTGRLARAAGCEVVGIDVNPWAVERCRGRQRGPGSCRGGRRHDGGGGRLDPRARGGCGTGDCRHPLIGPDAPGPEPGAGPGHARPRG